MWLDNISKPFEQGNLTGWIQWISALTGNVRWEFENLTTVSNCRHTLKNDTTELLDRLEVEFADNKVELAKVLAISVKIPWHVDIWNWRYKQWIANLPE